MSTMKIIENFKTSILVAKNQGITLQNKLFFLFFLFIIMIMSGLFFILIISGVFSFGLMEQKSVLENQLTNTSSNIYNDFAEISTESVTLSQSLSVLVENYLSTHNSNYNDLTNQPDMTNELLNELFYTMQFSLQKIKCSGIFIILDNSLTQNKSGIFIKKTEPKTEYSQSPVSLYLRGPTSIALANNLKLHLQWCSNFNVTNADYFYAPLYAAKDSTLPLSHLYYWSESINLPGVSERGMLCSVPLITSNNIIIGVCGFEVSSTLFNSSNQPVIKDYSKLFCMLSPVQNGKLKTSSSLYSGTYSSYAISLMDSLTPVRDIHNTFYTYQQSNGTSYAGLHSAIALYPSNSYFQNEKWVVTLLMPKEYLMEKISGINKRLISLLLFLMLINICLAIYISSRYIKPLINAIHLMKTLEHRNLPKTKILEINDLFEFLSTQDETIISPVEDTTKTPSSQSFTAFVNFVKNIDTLTKTERAIFNLYMKGFTAKEIAELLFVSINTIKTHNKHIYAKLNVSCRKELLVYVNMMEETTRNTF